MEDGVSTAAVMIWGITLLLIALVIVPLATLLLHRTLRAARSIESYLGEMREAGSGVARNTAAIPALDETIATAVAMGGVAAGLEGRSLAIAGILGERAARGARR